MATTEKTYARPGRRDRKQNRLGILSQMYMDIEKLRVAQQVRQSHLKLDNSPFAEDPAFEMVFDRLKGAQTDIDEQMMPLVTTHPCWTDFSLHVKGIGPHLLALVMGLIRDIEPFTNVSKLWWLCGLGVDHTCECEHWHSAHIIHYPDEADPYYQCSTCDCTEFRDTGDQGQAQRPVKGVVLNYDARLKSILLGRIGAQLLKNVDPFSRMLYEEYRDKEEVKRKEGAHRRSIRKVVKLYVSCLWDVWRRAEGFPVTGHYAQMHMQGHTDIITPERWVSYNQSVNDKK